MWNLARRGADRDAKIEPAARKSPSVRRSHLMHPMSQGFILSGSECANDDEKDDEMKFFGTNL